MQPHRLSILVLASLLLAAPGARAQFGVSPAADLVLGAPDFDTVGTGSVTQSGMENPSGLAVDPVSGKVFVSISQHNRILRFASSAALSNGANAEAVIGQANYTESNSGTTASTLSEPWGIDIDDEGRLWVCDYGNDRVLMYEDAANLPEFNASADLVLGQPDFTTATPTVSQSTMFGPTGLHVDASGNLWVAEYDSNRVVKFANAAMLTNGAPADRVIGQPDFNTSSSETSDVKMYGPVAVHVDHSGRLWVADQNNNRVLGFDGAATLADGAAADVVLGQPDFITASSGITAAEMSGPNAFAVDRLGTLYITDYGNSRILYHRDPGSKTNGATPDGVIGQPDLDTVVGDVTAQKLESPYGGLDFDAAGKLWVADFGNNRALRFPGDFIVAPPTITGRVPGSTTASKIPLRGTAADPAGISAVQYRLGGKGPIRNASGTTTWRFTAKLKRGRNKIEVVAIDGWGNMSPLKVVRITRKSEPRKPEGGSKIPPFLLIRS